MRRVGKNKASNGKRRKEKLIELHFTETLYFLKTGVEPMIPMEFAEMLKTILECFLLCLLFHFFSNLLYLYTFYSSFVIPQHVIIRS